MPPFQGCCVEGEMEESSCWVLQSCLFLCLPAGIRGWIISVLFQPDSAAAIVLRLEEGRGEGGAASDLCLFPSTFLPRPALGTWEVTQVLPWTWTCCHMSLFISDARITEPGNRSFPVFLFMLSLFQRKRLEFKSFAQPGSATQVLQPSLTQADLPSVLPAAEEIKPME